MLKFFMAVVICAFGSTGCQSASLQERAVASQDLIEVPYAFDQKKVAVAKDSFHFMRSFVDYFYLLIKNNEKRLQTVTQFKQFNGWCVGDAHPENFGYIFQKNSTTLFTMNDMDDAGPCPLAYDLYRLMVSSQLYISKIDNADIIEAYIQGLEGHSFHFPDELKDLRKQSMAGGFSTKPQKVDNKKLIRDSLSADLDAATLQQLKQAMAGMLPGFTVIDAFKTVKVGGGSGGLTRYEVLLIDQTKLVQLELKELVQASVYPVATAAIPPAPQRLAKTLQIEQGGGNLPLYGYLKFQNMDLLYRPIIDGNVGVALDKNSPKDNRQIIYYEAFTLGQIHRSTATNVENYVKLLRSTSNHDWDDDVQAMADQMDRQYKKLSH